MLTEIKRNTIKKHQEALVNNKHLQGFGYWCATITMKSLKNKIKSYTYQIN